MLLGRSRTLLGALGYVLVLCWCYWVCWVFAGRSWVLLGVPGTILGSRGWPWALLCVFGALLCVCFSFFCWPLGRSCALSDVFVCFWFFLLLLILSGVLGRRLRTAPNKTKRDLVRSMLNVRTISVLLTRTTAGGARPGRRIQKRIL